VQTAVSSNSFRIELLPQVKSHVTRHTSHTSHVTRHTSHVTRHTSHVTRHTSHVTRHTSHTSHVTRRHTRCGYLSPHHSILPSSVSDTTMGEASHRVCHTMHPLTTSHTMTCLRGWPSGEYVAPCSQRAQQQQQRHIAEARATRTRQSTLTVAANLPVLQQQIARTCLEQV
jgi:hypothetical protein